MDDMKDIMLVPQLSVALPKLPVLLLKTAGVAVHAAKVPSSVKLRCQRRQKRRSKRASIAVAMVTIKYYHFNLLLFLFSADMNPSYMIEITAFDDELRSSVSEIVVESLLAIFSVTSHCSCSSRWQGLEQTP